MIDIYTKEDYAKSYTELIEILKYISKSDLNKIPKDKIKNYIKNKDNNYIYIYDSKKNFENQNISKLTKILIANLYIEYWADEEEKAQIKINDRKEIYDIDNKNAEKYRTDNIFEKKKKTNEENVEETSLTIIKKKNFIQKIIEKIKKKLKLT